MVAVARDTRAPERERVLSGDPAAMLRLQRQSARSAAQNVRASDRLSYAMCYTTVAISAYWEALQDGWADLWPLPDMLAPIPSYPLTATDRYAAVGSGQAAALLDPLEAGYHLGALYTALLPDDLRARLGVYYTPPALSKRLLTLAGEAGVDWATCRVLDIACGGGAFLTPIALRIVDAPTPMSPRLILQEIHSRLRGFEIDPFGAWMSQALLEASLFDVCRGAEQRLPLVVRVCDSLEQEPRGAGYDLVIGNPPYGRAQLSQKLRARYQRSLFGHANLYGVFTDMAVRWTREGGVIALVTPTSFLGGEYFKRLRALLATEAPPVAVDFITDRKGVFADVLQEASLATYRRGGARRDASVHIVTANSEAEASVEDAGTFVLPRQKEDPWLLPRTADQSLLISRLRGMPHRLKGYGYQVSTGPLVWNRHKSQLCSQYVAGAYPLIWAESISPDGRFVFRAAKKNHQPYFKPRALVDDWLVTRTPCALVQRTTAKEQRRRLIAAELPMSFIREHGAVVIENHVNMIRPIGASPRISAATLVALLKSDIVDEAFRCMSGSVAVSASELEALPLPAPMQLARVESMLREGVSHTLLDDTIRRMYLYGDTE